MKKIFACLLALTFSVSLLASCAEPFSVINDPVSSGVYLGIMEKENDELSDIMVTFELDYKSRDYQKVNVYVNNKSDKGFTGYLVLDFYDKEGNSLGNTTETFRDIEPGNYQWMHYKIDLSNSIKMEYRFDSYSFSLTTAYGTPDSELTKALRDYFQENFGNPSIDWAHASWYDSIVSIEVYKNDFTYCSVIEVTDSTAKSDVVSIANAVFNYSKGLIAKSVIVDTSENEIYTAEK